MRNHAPANLCGIRQVSLREAATLAIADKVEGESGTIFRHGKKYGMHVNKVHNM